MEVFVPQKIDAKDTPLAKLQKMRANSLGSLFYFIRVPLRRKRLTEALHKPWCQSLEREHLKDVYELPRDHFKTTICSEGFPMWRSLPFENKDEDYFKTLGYSDEFIRFMKRIHQRDKRNLLVAENITNAAKLGSRIAQHYESNSIFRALFPEVIPDSKCTWSSYSLHHKRSPHASAHGEGTYDFLGVGGALQSRHYDGLIIQDDLVGRKAVESISVMEKTIDYHKLVVGAFETDDSVHENDEFIVGNRWSYLDLNSHIREHEDWFRIVTHSALGGCCPEHTADVPIFPEEFSTEKLDRWRRRLGSYHFSCFPLGTPVLMSDFREKSIEDIKVGDEVVGYSLEGYPCLTKAKVEAINRRTGIVIKVPMKSGRVVYCTHDHKWLKRLHRERGPYESIIGFSRNGKIEIKLRELLSVYVPPRKPTENEQRSLDWLGGLLDGEGSCSISGQTTLSQSPERNPEVHAEIARTLVELKIPYAWRDDCSQFILHGGRSLKVRLLSYAKMAKFQRFIDSFWNRPGRVMEDGGLDEICVDGIEVTGEQEVYNIQTSTGNYVAWGYATKNCQFLNNPAAPENADFKEEWLQHISVEEPNQSNNFRQMVRHEVRDGIVRKDIPVSHLAIAMAVDPNHSGNAGLGRCRHAIVVLGMASDGSYYLLDVWAKASSYDEFYAKIFELAAKWNLRKFGLETIAAQKYIGHHIKTLCQLTGKSLKIVELKGEVEGPDGELTRKKEWRIRNVLAPIFESCKFYTQRKFQDFLGEYNTFPKGRYVDQLDAMAYIPQMIRMPQQYDQFMKSLATNQQGARAVNPSYTVH